MKKTDKQISVTFQVSEDRKIAVDKMATRLTNGNVSSVLNLMTDFIREHAELFGEWLKARAVKSLEKKGE